MGDPLSQANAAFSLIGRIKSFFDKFGPTTLSIIGVDPEWIGGQLIYRYRLRVAKPKYSRSASKSAIPFNIPKNLNFAEFNVSLPEVQVGPLIKPTTMLNVSAHELIGDYLKQLRDRQEIPVSLMLPCPWEEVLQSNESTQGNDKMYHIKIKNPNDFPVRSCDIERTILLTDHVRDIEIVKQHTVASQRLIKLSKTYSVDFEAGKFQTYFPSGISASDDAWFKEKDETDLKCIANRAESCCILRFTLDLDAHDEIEIRLHLS